MIVQGLMGPYMKEESVVMAFNTNKKVALVTSAKQILQLLDLIDSCPVRINKLGVVDPRIESTYQYCMLNAYPSSDIL